MQPSDYMRYARRVLVPLLLTACATSGARRSSAAAGGDVAVGHHRAADNRDATAAVDALVRRDYAAALAHADRGLGRQPDDPWLLYDRGVALAGAGKVDDALAALRRAEQRFTDGHDRALCVYRRALVLESAGRCAEASTEYTRYAALVRKRHPEAAREALTHLYYCVSPNAGQLAGRDDAVRLRIAAADATRRAAADRATGAARALIAGDYAAALAEADAGLAIAPTDAWLWYDRGTALAALGRTDESLAALQRAERAFSAGDVHGRAVATWRRALALETAGRCREEEAELAHFATLTGEPPDQQARHARAHLRFCKLAAAARAVY